MLTQFEKNINKERLVTLKVKVKSLTAESKIIRDLERKHTGFIRDSLADHRKLIVRVEARASQLAAAFLKGKKYKKVESYCKDKPYRDQVIATKIKNMLKFHNYVIKCWMLAYKRT